MKAAEYRFNWRGDIIRVIVVGDVLALPDEKWSMGGFGSRISREWLLYEAKLPAGPSVPCHVCMGSGFIPADGAL